jgi:2-C-methyl-D-erythritol 4-phosphate cytidylyltransferase
VFGDIAPQTPYSNHLKKPFLYTMTTVIIVAAGKGTRMGARSLPKQFLTIEGVPILGHTLKRFDSFDAINQIVLVTRHENRVACQHIIEECGIQKITAIIEGGKERQDSVFKGLQHVTPQTEIVLIHDAVRMFITRELVEHSIRDARQYGASILAVPVKDTIKQAGPVPTRPIQETQGAPEIQEAFMVTKTLDRETLWQVQTPQTFQYHLIREIYQKAQSAGIYGTDDAMLAEYFGYPVKIVPGSYRNIKITTPDDLLIARAFLARESRE